MKRLATVVLLPVLLGALACGSSDPAPDPGPSDTPPLEDVQFDAPDVPGVEDAADVPVTVDMGPDAEPCTITTSPSGYRDNCNGTVTDTNSGLTWEKGFSWAGSLKDATTFCEASQTGTFEDWRVPTIDELRTLILGCPATAAYGDCPVHHDAAGSCEDKANASCWLDSCYGCANNQGPTQKPGDPTKKCYLDGAFDWQCSILFWSASQVKAKVAGDKRTWFVTFYNAGIDVVPSMSLVDSSALRCVRGP